MENNKRWRINLLLILLISILAWGCKEKEIYLGQFSPKVWKRDFNGCGGNREEQIVYLYRIRKEFYGIGEDKMVMLLGRPSRQELGERGRKTYLYYYKGGKACTYGSGPSKLLVVDIDALNRVALMTVKME